MAILISSLSLSFLALKGVLVLSPLRLEVEPEEYSPKGPTRGSDWEKDNGLVCLSNSMLP